LARIRGSLGSTLGVLLEGIIGWGKGGEQVEPVITATKTMVLKTTVVR
jgi:hypothetical protein